MLKFFSNLSLNILISVILTKNMYRSNANVRHLVNLIFQHNLVQIVNNHNRVTKSNATLIDYIITNSFAD